MNDRMARAPYAYVWSYRVSAEDVEEFIRLYGPDGAWVALFRQGEGYLGTDLLRDATDAGRFVTIDRWVSELAFDRFRETFAEEYQQLDREGEVLTIEELPLGEFHEVGAGDSPD
jgi:heme-degrading monooxygenase HmoA